MIIGVGMDIVEVGRVQRLWADYGQRFAHRILDDEEREELARQSHPEWLLAKRFAVKEAFGKAIGTGIRYPVTWTRIGLGHDPLGRPHLRLHAEVEQLLTERGVRRHHVSVSDERHFASAIVILED